MAEGCAVPERTRRPWTAAERSILHSLASTFPRGSRRWQDEKFVDVFMMGRLRGLGRSVSEVMSWGTKTGGEDSEDESESGHADRFHPSNFPLVPSSTESGASRIVARRAPSISSQTSRTFELAINAIPSSSALDSHPTSSGPSGSNRRRIVDSASNTGPRRTSMPAPLGPSTSSLYLEPRRPSHQPSGRFVAPDVRFPASVSSSSLVASPTQPDLPTSRNPSWASFSSRHSLPQTPRPVSPNRPTSPTQSALSYLNAPSLVSFPSRPESVHGEPVESFEALPRGNHRAILLQRLGDAEEAAEEDPRLAQALGVLLEMGYVGCIGSAGNTRPNGESDRFVFVQSAPVNSLTNLSSPARSATPDDRPVSNRRTSSNLTSTTASGSASSPASRGRPRRRATGATRRSTRSSREPNALAQTNASPASSTRSRSDAARSLVSEPTAGHNWDHASSSGENHVDDGKDIERSAAEEPTDESEGRDRVVSNPRPRRRRRPDGPSPLEPAESVSVSSLAETTSSYSTARSNASLPTPSPEVDTRPSSRGSLPASVAVHPTHQSLVQVTQDDEDVPIALRRTPRSSAGSTAITSAPIGRTRGTSNAFSSTSVSQPSNSVDQSELPTPTTATSGRFSSLPLQSPSLFSQTSDVDSETHSVSDNSRTSQASPIIPLDVFQSSPVVADSISDPSTSHISSPHLTRAEGTSAEDSPGSFERRRGMFDWRLISPSSSSAIPAISGEPVVEGRGMRLTRSRSDRSRRRLSVSGTTTSRTSTLVSREIRCSTLPPPETPSEPTTLPPPTTRRVINTSEYAALDIQPRPRSFLRPDRLLSTVSNSARASDSTPFLRNIRPPSARSRPSVPSLRTSHLSGPTTVSNFSWTPSLSATASVMATTSTTTTPTVSLIPASPTHTLLSLTSTMSSENDLPLDRNPPPAYERSLGQRAEYVAPPSRPRRAIRRRDGASEGNSLGGIAGRLLNGGSLRNTNLRSENDITRGEDDGGSRTVRGRGLRGLH